MGSDGRGSSFLVEGADRARIGVGLNNGILPGMRCGHCGFAGNLREKSLATIKSGGYVSPDGFNNYNNYQWHVHVRVMQCPECEGLIVYTYREWHYEDPADWPVTMLYPQPTDVRD